MDLQKKPASEPPLPLEDKPIIQSPDIASEKKLRSRTPRSFIVFLLLVFPPLAWIFMWVDKTYHHWFVKILLLSGIITLVSLAAYYLTITPNLSLLYESMGIENKYGDLIVQSNAAGVVCSILQILFALYLGRVLKKADFLHHWQLAIALFFLLFNLYVSVIGPLIILQSVYQLYGTI